MKILFILSSIVLLGACSQQNIKPDHNVFSTSSFKQGAGQLSVADYIIATDEGNLKVKGLVHTGETKIRSRKRVERIKLKNIIAILPTSLNSSEHKTACGIKQKSFDRVTMTTLWKQSCESVVQEMISAVSKVEHVMVNDNFYATNGVTCIHPKVMLNTNINEKGYRSKKMCVKTDHYLEYDQFIKTGLNDFISD